MITATIGTDKYRTKIDTGKHTVIMDEPPALGGTDLGPDPVKMLMASLASCIAITLRMYIERKGWDIPELTVTIDIRRSIEETVFLRHISVKEEIEEKKMKRLYMIASKCPVSKILSSDIRYERLKKD